MASLISNITFGLALRVAMRRRDAMKLSGLLATSAYLFQATSIRGEKKLDVQILHIERVVFDELAPGLYVLAHQRGEDGFALGDVFQLH
jgi:hypothetical protein